MTSAAAAVLAWLWSQPSTLPRTVNTAIAASIAASETDAPTLWISVLDTWAFGESRYSDDPNVAGGCDGVQIGTFCPRERAKYCGPWMVQCRLVPRGSSLVDEARIALSLFRESARECPAWPFGIYSGAGCRESQLVNQRMNVVVRMLAGGGA